MKLNPEVEEINIGTNETNVLQYLDDTTTVLSNLDSANALFEQLDHLKKFCGLEINSSKTDWYVDWVSKEQRWKTIWHKLAK